jgi:two-component sensor histidine kinase
VLHELATNAVKYGALSVTDGRVSVAWSAEVNPETGARSVVLRWSETGGPPVAPPQRRGSGTDLIQRQVRDALKGKVELAFAAGGFGAVIAFPSGADARPVGGAKP